MRHAARGFTLLEVLVALVIIGLVVGEGGGVDDDVGQRQIDVGCVGRFGRGWPVLRHGHVRRAQHAAYEGYEQKPDQDVAHTRDGHVNSSR